MTPTAETQSVPSPNADLSHETKQAMDWLLTDAYYNGRLSVREYNSRVRALWQQGE